MLNLAAYTKLSPEEVFERANRYFLDEQKLTPVEIIAHLHSGDGAAEIRSIGKSNGNGSTHLSEEVLWSQVKHLTEDFSFEVVHYALHAHASVNPDYGHLVVYIRKGEVTEVDFESHELEYPVREFVKSLPIVKPPVSVR